MRFRFSLKFPALSFNKGRDPLLQFTVSFRVFGYFAYTQHNLKVVCLSWGFVPFSVYGFRSLFIPGFPGLAQSARRFSQPFSGLLLLSLSGLFHPVTLLGFSFRAFSFKRLVSSFEAPYPPAVGCFAPGGRVLRVGSNFHDEFAVRLQGFVPS